MPGIEADEINTETATIGQVLTADGAGGAAFEDAAFVVGGDGSVASANATNADGGGIAIGNSAQAGGSGIAVGYYAEAGSEGVAHGYSAHATGGQSISIGGGSYATAAGAVALGAGAYATASSAVAIGVGVQNAAPDSIRIGWGNGAGDYMQMADFTPAAGTPTATHTIPVTLNGATYKVLLSNA